MLLLDSDQFLANGLGFLNLWKPTDQIAHQLEVAINQNLGTDDKQRQVRRRLERGNDRRWL